MADHYVDEGYADGPLLDENVSFLARRPAGALGSRLDAGLGFRRAAEWGPGRSGHSCAQGQPLENVDPIEEEQRRLEGLAALSEMFQVGSSAR